MTTILPDPNDTIVALSSAAGPGGRAIVRLSGRRAADIATSLCPEIPLATGRFSTGKLRLPDVSALLDVDVYLFAAPRTYTGQDVVEIHLIGSPPLADAVIAACLNAGARAAGPGEFTLRAFLAGKLDLTRAEAILGVIEADDRSNLQQALGQLAGGVAQPVRALREDLLNLLADIEAGLDFADEDIQFVQADAMLKRLGAALAHVLLLKRQLARRAVSHRPFRIALAGPPNAGKSSLFNAFVGRDAALVSDEPGTTRDYLEKAIDIEGMKVELIDTAGLRETDGEVEATAQSLGRQQTVQADLVVWCIPCDESQADIEFPPNALRVATKVDLAPAPAGLPATSAHTGSGLSELRTRLADHVRQAGHAALTPSLSRCSHHVDACLQHLQNAHAIVIEEGMPELLAVEVRLAVEQLGAMVGAVYTEDLLDRIFSRFCIGK